MLAAVALFRDTQLVIAALCNVDGCSCQAAEGDTRTNEKEENEETS